MNHTIPEVVVCTGTTCYVMGAAELIDGIEATMETTDFKCRLSGSTCIGRCKNMRQQDAPFVQVGDETISRATLAAVLDKAREART